ncbi:MAG TPA: NUDIX domain-containing protein [Candidatus Kapabacteria bacterium]|nr:NUDIX domain-containing protein [Candidatus Kapabacteria bacterium]
MEYIDIVNEEDNVIGQRTQEEVYQQHLRHRIVHVVLFRSNGNMVLQKRSAKKSFCPLHWVTAGSGHVQAGETYAIAAQRELEEEVGIQGELQHFKKDTFEGGGLQKFLGTFEMTSDDPVRMNTLEVESVGEFSLHQIKDMLASGEKFHPEFLFLLQKYYLPTV